jgi:hypothetical protein
MDLLEFVEETDLCTVVKACKRILWMLCNPSIKLNCRLWLLKLITFSMMPDLPKSLICCIRNWCCPKSDVYHIPAARRWRLPGLMINYQSLIQNPIYFWNSRIQVKHHDDSLYYIKCLSIIRYNKLLNNYLHKRTLVMWLIYYFTKITEIKKLIIGINISKTY